jgi:hypothetical protein
MSVVLASSGMVRAASDGSASDAAPTHLVTVPRLAKAPAVDGKLEPGEWDGAAALTAHINCAPGSEMALVIEKQDVTWYVAYDDQYLYIAMDNPLRPGTWPRAQAKAFDDQNLLWDDHIEVTFSPHSRTDAVREGWGFYKLIGNAKGFFSDEHFYNGTPGTEKIWSIGGDYKCHVEQGLWQLEMRIALAAINVKSLDHRSLFMQLVRADHSIGAYFAGIRHAGWMGFGQFFEFKFDPDAPVFRFTKRGKIREGRMQLDFESLGAAEKQPLEIRVEALDPKGGKLYEKTLNATIEKGKKTSLKVDDPIELKEDSVDYQLNITAKATVTNPRTGVPAEQLLYANNLKFGPINEKRYNEFIVPWMERQGEPGAYNWTFRYWPSYGIVQSETDLDLFGIDKKLADSTTCVVEVRDAAGKVVASGEGKQEKNVYRLQFVTGKLPEGDYTAVQRLLAADGKVVSEKTETFPVKRYPWEGNRLGLDEVLVEPYQPLAVDAAKRTVSPVLRRYTLGASGLPESIVAGGDGGDQEILAAPIRLEAETGGAIVTSEEAQLAFGEARPTVAPFTAGGRIGGVPYTVNASVEQDGWIDLEVTLKPGAAPTALDRLTLVIPLWPGADTMYIHRQSDLAEAWKNAIPAGTGVVWSSKSMLPMPTDTAYWGSFAPIAYAGSGDKGVWWFAEECRDWQHGAERGAIEYIRTDKGVELRVNFFAAPVTVDRERRLHFALLVDPVKAYPDERKQAWRHKQPAGVGLIFGWRWWGRSGDGYYITDEDTKALSDLLHNHDRRTNVPTRAQGRYLDYLERLAKKAAQAIEEGGEITLYGSNSNGSLDLPEFDAFYGEWGVGRPDNGPLPAHEQQWNIQASYLFQRKREFTEAVYNWTQSKLDCFIWYHEKLLRETPVTGTWWDNASSFLITDYDSERKEFYKKYSVFVRRQVMKRLNVICTQLKKPRMSWLNNQGVDWSWNQASWHCENGFYILNDSILDQMSVDQYRALFRIRRGIVHCMGSHEWGYDPAQSPFPPDRLRMRSRSDLGLALLHDIGPSGYSQYESAFVVGKLNDWVGFFDEKQACPFTGYWRNEKLVKVNTPGVQASVYQGKDRAAVILMNTGKDPVRADATLLPALLGKKISHVYDGETGRELHHFWGNWGDYQKGLIELRGYDFRLLLVE